MDSVFSNKIRVRVCGFLFDESDRLLLVEHRGLNASDSYWLPPGGGIEFGETTNEALIREFKEETNLEITVGKFLKLNEYIRPPLHAIELFYAVESINGIPTLGTDPELGESGQLLKSIKFVTLEELQIIPNEDKHQLLWELKTFQDLINS